MHLNKKILHTIVIFWIFHMFGKPGWRISFETTCLFQIKLPETSYFNTRNYGGIYFFNLAPETRSSFVFPFSYIKLDVRILAKTNFGIYNKFVRTCHFQNWTLPKNLQISCWISESLSDRLNQQSKDSINAL